MHTIAKEMQYGILYTQKEMYAQNFQMVPVLAKKPAVDPIYHFKDFWENWVSCRVPSSFAALVRSQAPCHRGLPEVPPSL